MSKTKQNNNKTEQQNPNQSTNKKRRSGGRRRTNTYNGKKDVVKEAIQKSGRDVVTANDVGWYSNNPELLKSSTSLPFGSILGSIYGRGTDGASVPGIMAIHWNPNFGSGECPIALNQASDSMYSYVVHANSRNYSYTAPDLMVLTLAGMQVFSIIGAMIRAFGVIKYYIERNAYLPDKLLQAMGFSASSLRNNLSTAWFDINNLINRTRQVWVPNKFPLLERWFWLNSNVFKDADGDMAQIYVFVQDHYFMFSETGVNTGSALIPATYQNKPFSVGGEHNFYDWNVWVNVANNMIDKLINSEDRGIIYGDLLNAYGAEQLYSLPTIGSEYVVAPVYSPEVLTQIENLTPMQNLYPLGLVQYEEDLYPVFKQMGAPGTTTGGHYSDPTILPHYVYNTTSSILNFHITTQPTPEMITVATRLTGLGQQVKKVYCSTEDNKFLPNLQKQLGKAPSTVGYVPYAAGSEIVDHISIYSKTSGMNYWSPIIPGDSCDWKILDFMAFDWHPFFIEANVAPNEDLPLEQNLDVIVPNLMKKAYGDFDNYTVLECENLRKTHDTAMFSLFGVPHI